MLGLCLHHVGIACADIDHASEFVKRAFRVHSDSGTVFDPLQNAFVRIFNEGQPGAIELVSGPIVQAFVAKKTTYYHLCYGTPDIVSTVAAAKAGGSIIVSRPKPAVLFAGRLVAFVHTPLGLIEFLEER
ncbi:MAG: VOC family protein [Candidatus Baltobacteraceae bacterium]|jgi:catechol 2,3-dioxygenase-like lactoylglutathione lyase family enzyme